MRIHDTKLWLMSGAFGLSLFASNGTAQSIAIVNPGYELPVYSAPNGGYPSDPKAYGDATNWTDGYYTGTGTRWTVGAAGSGNINPGPTGYGYKGVAHGGEQCAYTTSYTGYGQGLAQILTTTLQANTTYHLRAVVGYPLTYNVTGTAKYSFELLAGGVLLASTSGSIAVEKWTPVLVSFTSGSTGGGNLEIRIVSTDVGNIGTEMNWDSVTLDSCKASATNYGKGLTGTNGVPTLSTSAAPKFGASISLLGSNSSGSTAVGAIVIGLAPATLPFLGGTLNVSPLVVVNVSVPSGGLVLPFKVPAECMSAVYLQLLQLDSGASAGLAMTPGLRIMYGK